MFFGQIKLMQSVNTNTFSLKGNSSENVCGRMSFVNLDTYSEYIDDTNAVANKKALCPHTRSL